MLKLMNGCGNDVESIRPAFREGFGSLIDGWGGHAEREGMGISTDNVIRSTDSI